MIKMTHNDDHKERWMSHTIGLMDDYFYNAEVDVYSHNPLEVNGYGASKDEAMEDFKTKFKYVMRELKAFEAMLFDTDVITDNIVEVDGLGKPIKD
jgi:hypothetical protein